MTHSQRHDPWTRRRVRLASILTLSAFALAAGPLSTAAQAAKAAQRPADWPRRVLLTNDDGINSPALRALAHAFAAAGIQTFVAAPSRDRSGTGSLMLTLQMDSVVTEKEDLGPGIEAWAVNAFPADCVLFALYGPMKQDPPDLIVSGPNEGANVGEAWFISGTIGAARAAAFMGVPAVAISGANVRDTLSVQTIARWAVQFVRSEPVRRLRAPQYLDVNVPINPRSVRGVTVAGRARLLSLTFERDPSAAESPGQERWLLRGSLNLAGAKAGTDAYAFTHDSIAIQPLRVGEQDPAMGAWLRGHLKLVPRWPIADTTGRSKKVPPSR